MIHGVVFELYTHKLRDKDGNNKFNFEFEDNTIAHETKDH